MLLHKCKGMGKIYAVHSCTKEEIPSHAEKVLPIWKECNADLEYQMQSLEVCVDSGYAFKVIDQYDRVIALIYCEPYPKKKGVLVSHLLWMQGKKAFATLAWYLRVVLNINTIMFRPHRTDKIPFRLLVSPSSIRYMHTHNTPLVVNLFDTACESIIYDIIEAGEAIGDVK